jgi:hypothetical protein
MASGVIYEIEGNLDFFKELKNMTTKHEVETRVSSVVLKIEDKPVEKCLITDERLRKDHIILKCGHKFNYVPLFKEVVFQKCSLLPKNVSSSIVTNYIKNTSPPLQSSAAASTLPTYTSSNSTTNQSSNITTVMYNSSYNLETTKVQYNEMKCPYCRSITSYILPYYSYPEVNKIKYVNAPADLSLPGALLCEYHQTKDPATETVCKTSCMYHETYDLMLCNKHFNKMEAEKITVGYSTKQTKANTATERITRRNSKKTNDEKRINEDELDNENLIISHHNPATTVCSFILLSGPRKGCMCGKPMWVPKVNSSIINPVSSVEPYCKAHYDKGNYKNKTL